MSNAKPPANFIAAIRTLSLDIVAGVIAVSYYFASFLSVKMPVSFWFSLGAFVWCVYLTDHLADSHLPGQYSNKEEVIALRAYRSLISKSLVIAFFLFIPSLFFLPGKIILFGLCLGLFVLGYLLVNQMQNHLNRSLFPREFIISVLYIAGTAGPPLVLAANFSAATLIVSAGFLMLILTNTLIFSYIDFDQDSIHGIRSLAVVRNPKRARGFGITFAMVAMIMFAYLYLETSYPLHALIGLSIALILFLLLIFIRKLPKRLTGILADGILLAPLFLLFF